MVNIGQKAPDFKAIASNEQEVALSKLRGKNVLLAFYCIAFSPVCTNEFFDMKKDFSKFGKTVILGVGSERFWVQKAFARSLNLPFLLLEDPEGKLAKAYGVLNKKLGFSNRAYFIIDKEGVIRYKFITKSPREKLPNAVLLAELEKLK